MRLTKKLVFIIISLVFVLSIGAVENKGKKGFSSEKVDEIYNSIRNASPKYEWEERTVTFQNEGMNMVCSLVVPLDTGSKPAIAIFLNGFAGDRKELLVTGTDEYIWERLSRIMAEQGVATLRIDYRGSGDSDGTFEMTTFETQISDAIAAVEYISKYLREKVDWKNIGLLGFSQGGLVAACTSARDDRVDSVLLWSPVSHPPMVYENLLSKEGVKMGLALPEGDSATFPIYVNEVYVDWDVPLGKGFFDGLFQVAPLTELSKSYFGPMMALCGQNDPIIWPQPHQSEIYLRYHDGFEKLVMLDADHAFNWWDGSEPEKFHDACYWSAAWFLHTLE
jgi:uncharacterized protein